MKKQRSTSYRDRVVKHWVTTAIGVGILAVSCYAVVTGKATLSELKEIGGWVLSSGLLIRSKDSLLGINRE